MTNKPLSTDELKTLVRENIRLEVMKDLERIMEVARTAYKDQGILLYPNLNANNTRSIPFVNAVYALTDKDKKMLGVLD